MVIKPRHLFSGLDSYKPRDLRRLRHVVIHRIRVPDPHINTPEGIREFFEAHDDGIRATGGRMAYHVIVEPGGEITQTIPLGLISPHCAPYNSESIGVACVGDFRHQDPTHAQWIAARDVCLDLLTQYPDLTVVGHSEIGDKPQGEECPGARWQIAEFREVVRNALGRMTRPPRGLVV